MSRQKKSRRTARLSAALALALGLLALGALTAPPAWTDDRDLLRTNIAKPYLFIMLDTSASMNLKIASDEPTELYGDDPDSRLYAAKEALFKVFSDVENVQFGFAMFNQDKARVVSKHWVYYSQDSVPPGQWPIDWPRPDPDTLTLLNPSDPLTPIKDIASGADLLVMGRGFDDPPPSGTPLTAGSCSSPLDLDTTAGRQRVNYFAKLGADSSETTTLWVAEGGTTYRLQVKRDDGSTVEVGQDSLPVNFLLDEVISCVSSNTATIDPADRETLDLTLRLDPRMNEFLFIDGVPAGGEAGIFAAAPGSAGGGSSVTPEQVPGRWDWADGLTDNDCGAAGPHTGGGWESNYDSGELVGDPRIDPLIVDDDTWCTDLLDPDTCVRIRPVDPTVASSLGRALDRGDVLPLDWKNDYKTRLLQRLAPNYPTGVPDFRVSPHLKDAPGPLTGLLEPRIAGRPPLMASGVTPLGEAVLDFRCWYAGENSNKCGKINGLKVFSDGWEAAACKYDTLFDCRRPYLIVISDGQNSCPGNSPTSEVASLRSKTGIETWALNVGTGDCKDSELKFAEGPGKGACVNIMSKEDLLDTLDGILGQIVSDARTFAAAAVPTVQSNANETIFLSSFLPMSDTGFWDGHLRNFQKPVPIDPVTKIPDIDDLDCTDGDGCVLWDAAAVLATAQFGAPPLDLTDQNKRRVFYSRQTAGGDWANKRQLLLKTADPGAGDPDELRYDLWRGFGLIPADTPNDDLPAATELAVENVANDLIDDLLSLKSGTLGDGTPVNDYLLGDIFHSQPLIVEAPPNNFYFAQDAGSDADPTKECLLDNTAGNFDRGYRCFLQRQINRRKLLLVGANDGMLHAFDAGQYDRATGEFDSGTGREVWAYMPRLAMSTLRLVNESGNHRFSVDGSPSVADVFIDPVFPAAGPTAAQRLWRTVAITGFREGGSGYFALDITQPEPLEDLDADPTNGIEFVPADPNVPGAAKCGNEPVPADCGPVSYPVALWELADTTADSLVNMPPTVPLPMDEDANGAPDLGDTWSTANIGRIRVCDGAECDPGVDPNDVREVFVAVFGGGMDSDNKDFDPRGGGATPPPLRGNFLYMVDVETGKVIYKQQLDGPAPGDAAAVDTDQDGYFDRIYIGTLFGSLYRVDLDADDDDDLPKLSTVTVSDIEGTDYDAERIAVDKNGNPTWQPVKIFDANFNGNDPTDVPRSIYYAPSVFFVTKLGLYGLAFGTGERDDLTSNTPEGTEFQEGRFYVFVDDTGLDPGPALPLTESNFQPITIGDTTAFGDLLSFGGLGTKGWFLVLRGKEKVVSQAFSLLGVTFFSTFTAEAGRSDGETDRGCPADPKDVRDEITCSPTGTSSLFVTGTVNAQPFLKDPDSGESARYRDIAGAFVSNPFTEVALTEDTDDDPGPGTSDDLTDDEKEVMEAIKALFPANCRFTSQRIDVKLITSDTKVERVAAVPVCVIEKNWKEF